MAAHVIHVSILIAVVKICQHLRCSQNGSNGTAKCLHINFKMGFLAIVSAPRDVFGHEDCFSPIEGHIWFEDVDADVFLQFRT